MKTGPISIACISSVFASVLSASEWGYTNQQWTGFCQGKSQSPINISGSTKSNTPDPIDAASFVASNFGGKHEVKLNDVDSHSTHAIKFSFVNEIGDADIKCAQFHCHFKNAEHEVDGVSHFGECHVVCYKALGMKGSVGYKDLTAAVTSNEPGALAVFGFLIEKSDSLVDDQVVQQIIDARNSKRLGAIEIPVPKNFESYYRYDGSLTTPTCNEVVTWTVFAETVKISHKQLDEISAWGRGNLNGNNRQIQALNDRKIVHFGEPSEANKPVVAVVDVSNEKVIAAINKAAEDLAKRVNSVGELVVQSSGTAFKPTVATILAVFLIRFM